MKNNSVKINLTFVGDKTVRVISYLLADIKRPINKYNILEDIKSILIKDFENQIVVQGLSDLGFKNDGSFERNSFIEYDMPTTVKIIDSIDEEPRYFSLRGIKSILIETEGPLHYIEIDRKDIMDLLISAYHKMIVQLLNVVDK